MRLASGSFVLARVKLKMLIVGCGLRLNVSEKAAEGGMRQALSCH